MLAEHYDLLESIGDNHIIQSRNYIISSFVNAMRFNEI